MLYTDDILFLHVPKTGGMSATTYLINNLPGEINLHLNASAFNHARASVHFPDVHDRLRLHVGGRHSRLPSTIETLAAAGRSLQSFKNILAVIRNPYDLEVSYFQHLRKSSVSRRRQGRDTASRLADANDFEGFAVKAPYYGSLPSNIEAYYQIDGETLSNLSHIRFETVEEDFRAVISTICPERYPLPHENRSVRPPYRDMLTAKAEQGIFDKYRYLFRFYPRERGVQTTAAGA